MKKAFKAVLIICAIILVAGVVLLAVSLFNGGGADAVITHGNVDGLIANLKAMFPILAQLGF